MQPVVSHVTNAFRQRQLDSTERHVDVAFLLVNFHRYLLLFSPSAARPPDDTGFAASTASRSMRFSSVFLCSSACKCRIFSAAALRSDTSTGGLRSAPAACGRS